MLHDTNTFCKWRQVNQTEIYIYNKTVCHGVSDPKTVTNSALDKNKIYQWLGVLNIIFNDVITLPF